MATKLKNLKLTSVDLVRAGANQEADICLYKSADTQEATEQPTEGEKNIFKRFIHWLRENPTEPPQETEDPVEKADEQPETAEIYKSAIIQSLKSIVADEALTQEQKYAMVEKSMNEYHAAMAELEKADSAPDVDDEPDVDDDDFYDEIEEIDTKKA